VHSRVLYCIESLYREVFEPILRAADCGWIFVRQSRKDKHTPKSSQIARRAVRQTFWPLLVAPKQARWLRFCLVHTPTAIPPRAVMPDSSMEMLGDKFT
jgi:hypothetical protein